MAIGMPRAGRSGRSSAARQRYSEWSGAEKHVETSCVGEDFRITSSNSLIGPARWVPVRRTYSVYFGQTGENT